MTRGVRTSRSWEATVAPIRTVNLDTNGIRLASDRRFVAELGERNRLTNPDVIPLITQELPWWFRKRGLLPRPAAPRHR